MITLLSAILLCALALPAGYWYLLALASLRRRVPPPALPEQPRTRFAVLIPAHDEAAVIAATVEHLRHLAYPPSLYHIHVVADHCHDQTATLARSAGATVHERDEGPRTGKGAALSWLLRRVLADERLQAVVIFEIRVWRRISCG